MTGTRIKLTTARRAALEDFARGSHPPTFEGVTWLRTQGYIARREGVRHLAYDITDVGREALRSPFISTADAESACKRWRVRRGPGPAIMGWAYLRCRGGGFGIRVGFESAKGAKPKPVLLPEGIDPELVRGR